MTPTNTCGHCVERYTHALGWKPCTEAMPLAQAEKQLEKLDASTHRVYWAFKTKDDQ